MVHFNKMCHVAHPVTRCMPALSNKKILQSTLHFIQLGIAFRKMQTWRYSLALHVNMRVRSK